MNFNLVVPQVGNYAVQIEGLSCVKNLITARKRSLQRLCFYRCLSVHGRGSIHGMGAVHVRGQCAWQGGMCGRGHVWQGGHAWQGVCLAGGHAWLGHVW